MSNKIAIEALQLAYIAMQHMGNVLNNMDAVDEEEDAQPPAQAEPAPAPVGEYPPLPEPDAFVAMSGAGSIIIRPQDFHKWGSAYKVFTADQMHAYLDADRAQRPAREVRLGKLDELRNLGWVVAVHNDYRLNGIMHTFWLFTRDGLAVKGEGLTDEDALMQVAHAIDAARKESAK